MLSAVGARCGKCFRASGSWSVVANTQVFLPLRGYDADYLWYVFNDEKFWEKGGTAQPYVRVPTTLARKWAFPPLPTQRAIADFLDRKTRAIDELIGKKERLIELLQEKRQALIRQAVTKGLDPNVPMKDSGVPWLGAVPAHWSIKRLKHFAQFLNHRRVPLSAEERSGLDRLYPYYGASGIIDQVDRWIFDEDLILVGEDGANILARSTRMAFIARGKYWVNNHAHILQPRDGDLRYWAERLEAISYVPFASGSAQPKLTKESLGDILIAAPGMEEQRQIGDFVESLSQKTDPVLVKLRSSIERLTEYRESLISAAVTGQIDVTAEAAA